MTIQDAVKAAERGTPVIHTMHTMSGTIMISYDRIVEINEPSKTPQISI